MDGLRLDRGRVGIAQKTDSGYLNCYLRLAVADRPYLYKDALGGTRTEIVTASELFRADSADTFKMLPITLQHPTERVVTPQNFRQFGRGATGHAVIRERTPHGDFLGITAAIYDKEAIDAIESGWQVSPGYRVTTEKRADGVFLQKNRRGNHTAIVKTARGGADVVPLLEGISLDGLGEDEAGIWCQDSADEDLWGIQVDSALILPLLVQSTPGIIDRPAPIVLPRADARLALEVDEEEGEEEPTQVTLNPRRKRKKAKGFGDCSTGDCPNCSKRGDSMVVQVNIDGIGYEFEEPLAARLTPHLERSARVDDLEARIRELEEENTELEGEIEELQAHGETLLGLLEDDDATDSADGVESLVAAIGLLDSMRRDGAILQERGLIGEFNSDAAFVLQNLDQLQREMIGAVTGDNCDQWDADQVSVAYDATFGALRALHKTDRSRAGGGRRADSLADIPDMIQPMGADRNSLVRMLKKTAKADDEAFEAAGTTLEPKAMSGSGQFRLM